MHPEWQPIHIVHVLLLLLLLWAPHGLWYKVVHYYTEKGVIWDWSIRQWLSVFGDPWPKKKPVSVIQHNDVRDMDPFSQRTTLDQGQ
jgi:hypothetical protein